MKIFILWCFCLPTVMFVSGRILNDTSSPQRRAINYNLSPNIIFLHPPPKLGQKIGRILYLKQLLKLKCFRKIFNDIRSENRLRYLNPQRTNNVSPFKNQHKKVLSYPKIRPNIITVEPQRKLYFGSNPIVFPPRKEKYTPKLTNRLQQKKISNATEVTSNQKSGVLSEKKQNANKVDDRQKSEDISKSVTSVSYPKTDYKPVPPVDHLQQQMNPTRIYEVTEAADEKIIIDFINQKNSSDSKNRQGLPYLRKGSGRHELKPKTNTDINNGMNVILRTLAKSGNSTAKKSKEIFYNSSDHSGYLASNSDNLPLISSKKFIEVKSTVSPQGKSKQLKITHPYFYETDEKSKETITKTTARIENDIETTVKVEKVKSYSTKVTNTPLEVLRTWEWPDQQTTEAPEIQTPDALINDVTSDISILFPFTDTETTDKDLTTSENENTSDFLVTLPETETMPTEEATKEFVNENVLPSNPSDKVTKYSEITESLKNITIGKNYPETGLTLPIFTEFTDLPLTIDLLTAFKKDQETGLKNSRKMHFNKEILTTTISNQVSESGDSEQRRSDILIDETVDDYLHDDGGSSLNYLKQLKQNNIQNSTSDSIIQLIPFVINDLRDDRIAPEDIPILSKAFGKYWNTVLALTNNTNIDMLPLLKMKNEEDLNNIVRAFFPENFSLFTADSKEIYRDNYMDYYYEEEYEDLREDRGKETEKTFRFKRDEESSRYFAAAEQNLVKYESGLNIGEDWRKNKSILLENEND